MASRLWNTKQQNKRLPKRIKQKYTYTQATEGKKSHGGVFNVKEKLYIWDGGEEDLTEPNKVSTASTSKRKDVSSTRRAYAVMHVQNSWPLKKYEVYFLHKCPWAPAASPLQWQVKFQHGIKGENVLPLVYSHVDWAGQISPLSRRHQGARGWLQVDSQAVRQLATDHTVLPHSSMQTFHHHVAGCPASRNGLQDSAF